MKKPVPDRWRDYCAIGQVVPGSKFIAFKVPLHRNICERLQDSERHTTDDVVSSIPDLGLVINLTNTQTDSKYYQPNDWQRYGVDYKWIRTEGHVTPKQSSLIEFCRTVKNFLVSNPEKLVGVHCTHGLNRTGYFICSFLVLCHNVSPSDALRNFSVARGHQIERPNYITAIMHNSSNAHLKRLVLSSGHSKDSSRRGSSASDNKTPVNLARQGNGQTSFRGNPRGSARGNRSGEGSSFYDNSRRYEPIFRNSGNAPDNVIEQANDLNSRPRSLFRANDYNSTNSSRIGVGYRPRRSRWSHADEVNSRGRGSSQRNARSSEFQGNESSGGRYNSRGSGARGTFQGNARGSESRRGTRGRGSQGNFSRDPQQS